jgi:integrase
MDDNHIELLFRSPLFTGCQSESRRAKPGKLIIKDELYWVLLLEAFAGVSLEEGCQLRCDDVRAFFGVDWLLVNSVGTNRTKNQASNRAVPVHRFLTALGFLEHVEQMRQSGKDRVFPGLRRDKRGRLGGTVTKAYKTYRDQIGLDGRGQDGHALRHAFDTFLHNENVPTVRLSELMGHEREGMTAGTYFKGSQPWLLWEAINRLTYGFKVETVDGIP